LSTNSQEEATVGSAVEAGDSGDSGDRAVVLRRADGPVVRFTLNRPKSLNALNADVLGALDAGVAEAVADDDVRVIVIDGAGDRAFCAGADLDELAGLDSAAAMALLARGQGIYRRIEQAPKPVIAAVDGFALGGGFELALSCHFILASDRARFGLPEALLGLVPGYGGTQRLIAAVGKPTALRVMLTGGRLDAAQAHAAGLVAGPPTSPDDLDAAVAELVEQLQAGTAAATAAILTAVRESTTPPALALAHEAAIGAIAIASEAGQAGIRAFQTRSRK
jgi:enoyl-CoA hydratase